MLSLSPNPSSKPPRRVLIVDEDDEFSALLRELLEGRGYRTALAGSADEAVDLLHALDAPVAIIDARLAQCSGLDVLLGLKAARPNVICIMITSHADHSEAILALRRGAYDYYEKSAAPADLYAMLNRAFEKHRLEAQQARSEQMLQTKSQQLDMALNNISQGLCMFDADARLVLCNTRYLEIYGIPAEAASPGIRFRDLLECPARKRRLVGDPVQYEQHVLTHVRLGERDSYISETSDGRSIRVVNHPMSHGGWVATHEDITDLLAAEKERDHSAEVLVATVNSLADAVLVIGRQGEVLLTNPAAARIFGDPAGFDKEHWAAGFERFEADGTTPMHRHASPLARAVRGEWLDNAEIALRRKGQSQIMHLVASARPLRDPNGTLTGAVLTYRDVTASKETERQLRHAQKMEAIGQLTGGVAHDFNNILTVITGTIEILADAVADRPKFAAIAKMISDAAERGADMTRQLLAFARKQPLQPRKTDVNALIAGSTNLLRASLGAHIELDARCAAGLWPALVDPSQLTTALLNLAVNARDAMPNGGRLTIETANVEIDDRGAAPVELQAGGYVLITVVDTGTGIPKSIRDKVFEPFFTTKGVGKGTGLGLSMVYGFVKQSGGHVRILSEEGRGTTFKIYLPRSGVPGEDAAAPDAQAGLVGGRETVLVVEDDPLVRSYVLAQIESLGYRTLQAANAAEALALVQDGAAFELLFTDIVMPGAMNGRELADAITRLRPAVRTVFTSGYTENVFATEGITAADVLLLQKPYRKADLARIFREALDRAAGSAAPAAQAAPAPQAGQRRLAAGE